MNKHVRYFGAVLLFLLAALLVLAAVPASVLARFRNRTARERKAAIAAFAGIPASFGQDFDPEIAAAAETLRAYGFPFVSSGFSNHFEPPTAGELAAMEPAGEMWSVVTKSPRSARMRAPSTPAASCSTAISKSGARLI